MNKRCYRLRFNQHRGLLMAVAETATIAGKAPGSTQCLLAVVMLMLWSGCVSAQVVADKAAPGNQQATVMQAPNQTLLVNVQTPSAAGVSRNTYSQFDVPTQGVILNNARSAVQTQLGGWVAANPWLGGEAAKVILNEVNAVKASTLQGFIEVAGSRADVVVANPAGIRCDGCGFINASRATLSTGMPVMKEGNLESYRVQSGSISINGAGMDASSTDYTALIARSMQINAGLWARQLMLTAGANEVDASGSLIRPIAGENISTDVPTAFAIDVAQLGGLYAGKIWLVGTEAGVGVRNAGQIGAAAGEVVITTEGWLHNAGQISSSGAIQLQAQDGIRNSGNVYAQAGLSLSTRGDIEHSGILAAQGPASLSATGSNSRISIAPQAMLAAGMTPDGSLGGDAALSINATQSMSLHGLAQSSGQQSLSAKTLDVSASQIAARSLTLDAEGDIDASSATLLVQDVLQARTTKTLRTDAAVVLAGSLDLSAQNLSNRDGELFQSGAGDFKLTLNASLDNSRGLIAATNTLTVKDRDAAIKTLAITNSSGRFYAGKQLTIDSASMGGDGALLSGGDLHIRLIDDYTHTGTLHAAGSATLETLGTLINHASMSAGGGLHLRAAKLNNEMDGEIQGGQVWLAATAPHALINRGLIDGDTTRIDSYTVKNLGTGRLYGDHIAINANILLNAAESGQAPVIAARNRLDIGATNMTNDEHALIFSAGDMAIGGTLDANLHATGSATSFNNNSATIEALGSLDLAAAEIRNTNAHLRTAVVSTESDLIEEYAGAGASKHYLKGTPGVYTFNDESDHLHTPEGNYEIWNFYAYHRNTTETTVLQTDPGQIRAGGAMNIHADTLQNDNSHIIAGGAITGQIGKLNNIEATGQRIITENGTVKETKRDHQDGRDANGESVTIHTSVPVIQTISLQTNQYAAHTASAGSSTPISPRANVDNNANTSLVKQVLALQGDPHTVILSGGINTVLSASSLFHPAPESNAHYLIETDPAFASYRQWISSDYLLQQLTLDPAMTQKRLGDGFYEQKLVREQVAQLTGRRFLDGYASDETQYQDLMNHAATFAQAQALRPGIALSAEQMATLTSDIIWLVEKEVTLPNGQTSKVLVPQLYVRVKEGDLQASGALIAGHDVQLNVSGDLINSGSIAGRQIVALTADNVRNLGGRISGTDLGIAARTDIDNLGGSLAATHSLTATAGRDLNVSTTVSTQTNAQGNRTNIDRVAGLYVSGSDGTLIAAAGRDLALHGGVINNTATTQPGTTVLAAGHNLNVDTVTERSSHSLVWDAHNYRHDASQTEVGSTIQTQGNVQLQAGNNVTTKGASISSEQGALTVIAAKDITLGTAQSSISVDEAHRQTSSGWFSSTTTTTRDTVEQTTQAASTLSAHTLTLQAGQDIRLQGSNAVSTAGTSLVAGRNVSIEAATNTSKESHLHAEKTSGLMGSGGMGFSIGTRRQTGEIQSTSTAASASTVGSTNGNVQIVAGKDYRQTGSDVLTPQGSIDIGAQSLTIGEARNTLDATSATHFKQSGLTVAVSNPVITAVQTAEQMTHAASNTQDSRMRTLAAANTAMAGANAFESVQAGQGSTINDKPNQIQTGTDDSGKAITRDATTADKLGGFTVSVSLGTSSSNSQTVQHSSTAANATVAAGADVHLVASGAGAHSDLTIQGATIKAGNKVLLQADNKLVLQAAQNTQEQNSTNNSKSASVGVALSSNGGVGITAAGSAGRGHADGNDVSWSNAQINASQVTLRSGSDTTLQGAVVKAEQVTSSVGGELLIRSLQDTSTYDSRQKNNSASVMIGQSATGNVQLASSKIDSDYASVTEQSGIKSGNGGFTVDVAGNTKLHGGVITSTTEAVEQNRNHFASGGALSIAEIDNRAHYTASAQSINIGTGINPSGKLAPAGSSVGLGRDGDSAASTTTAGISGIAGNRSLRTGDKEAGIAKIFDAVSVQKNIDAQVQITQTFGQLAPKAVADFAQRQADALLVQARNEPDASKRMALLEDAKRWDDGGSYRVAMHAAIGGMGGGVAGAAGAGTVAAAAPMLNNLQNSIVSKLTEAGVNPMIAKGAAQALTLTTATAVGTVAGGGSVQGAAAGLNVDANNRMLHIATYERLKDGCRGSSTTECQTINRIAGIRSGMPEDDSKIPASKVVSNFDANGNVVSYTLVDRNSNQPMMIMEPLDFAMYRNGSPGMQAMMQMSPQYALDFASAGIYASQGNTTRATEHVIAGVTSRDYARDVAFAAVGAEISAMSGFQPKVLVTSEGTANAATITVLKAQLASQNLANIAAYDSRLAIAIRGDGTGNMNFSVGNGTATEANRLGQIWVGDGSRLIGDQISCPGCLISADGTRIYRPPMPKASSYSTTGVQANFVQRTETGVVISNGHLNVTR